MDQANRPSTLSWRFWAIFPGICLSSFLCALDSTIISTALPTIVSDLGSSSLYVWAINGYTVTFTAVQPLYGQAADIFGRKFSLVASLVLFAGGSVACALASTTATLIGGRALQGAGGGGLSILPAMVVCDLIPLRQRQKYISIIYAVFAVGTLLGPVVGGTTTQHAGWPWIFWINLPLTGLALFLIAVFMRVYHNRSGGLIQMLATVDYIGLSLLLCSVVAFLYALSTGGAEQQWSSWRVLLPLLLGICVGLPLYLWYETTASCRKPTTPIRLFSNPTSLLAFALTFLHGIALYWSSYFLPVYFQGVLLSTPEQSGIDTLPSVLPMVPFGILGGILISKTGRYKFNQIIGYILMSIAFGCFSLLDASTSTGVWVVLQLVFAVGAGAVLTALLPAIQAPLPESDVGSSTATWGLVQSLGFVCGVAIPSSVFNSRISSLALQISDSKVGNVLSRGNAYTQGTRAYMITLDPLVRKQVIAIYISALKLVWQVGLAFSLLGFILALLICNVDLREDLETKYGYKEKASTEKDEEEGQSQAKFGDQAATHTEPQPSCSQNG